MRQLNRTLCGGTCVYSRSRANPYAHTSSRCQAFLALLQVLGKVAPEVTLTILFITLSQSLQYSSLFIHLVTLLPHAPSESVSYISNYSSMTAVNTVQGQGEGTLWRSAGVRRASTSSVCRVHDGRGGAIRERCCENGCDSHNRTFCLLH